jgi:flagellar biosynthesis protein FlhB
MAENTSGEKTEQPTSKKRLDARKKGDVAKSREVPSVAVLMVSLISLAVFGGYMAQHLQSTIKSVWGLVTIREITIVEFNTLFQHSIYMFLVIMAPLMGAIFLTAILTNVMQVGFMLTVGQIKPKFDKINPLKGLKRLFSPQSLNELFKALTKLGIIGAVAYLTVSKEMKNLAFLGDMELAGIIAYISSVIFKIFIRCTLAMVFIVAIDYAFQRWQFEKKLKMTKQEVKDEFKTTEGDPLVKSRIKSIQMQMARKRMMQDVPDADVVITNPTHLAIAIKYDATQMGAPRVVAKGAGAVAARIREVAKEHQVPIVENKPLARSLFKAVEIGDEIPGTLYQMVAEVLAYVYGLKKKPANMAAGA